MLNFNKLTISDKTLFDNYFYKYKQSISELNFTNLFIWRNHYDFQYTIIHDSLCILAMPKSGDTFAFFPVGANINNLKDILIELKNFFISINKEFVLMRVSQEQLSELENINTFSYEIIFDRDNSDYIYNISDLINLSGRKYSDKRNHIKNFISQFEYEYLDYEPLYYNQCLQLIETRSSEQEQVSILEYLHFQEKLNCKCAIVTVNNNVEAITVGEKTTDDTVVIHIEKANKNFNGLYNFINQKFCQSNWQELQYSNREQDLGIAGIKNAKLNYHPVKLINKFNVYIET